MPYAWDQTPTTQTLRLWPHQSLTTRGMVLFLTVTALLGGLPLAGLIGQGALWVVLVFILCALGAVWLAITTNRRSRAQAEELHLTADRMALIRQDQGRPDRHWAANPHWVAVALVSDGPVPAYLTLRGNGRTVELGAFLTPQERQTLHDDLTDRLTRMRAVIRP